MVNSRLGLSSAAGSSFLRCGVHQLRPSLSRSYGCILPSSLTRVFPRTLGYSPRLPVSVLVRARCFSLEAFLGSVIHGNSTLPKDCLSISPEPLRKGFASSAACSLRPAIPAAGSHFLLRHSIAQTKHPGTGIFACCPSPMLAASA